MKLNIEETPLTLGGQVDPDLLAESPFQKAGLVKRLFTRTADGRDLYELENPRLTCLTDDFTIFPCTHGYLDESRRWSTRASLYLRDGRLEEVLFQVIDGRYAAGNFLERFADVCTESLGDPVAHDERGTVWRNGSAVLTGLLHDNRVNADFRFVWTDGNGSSSS